MDELRNDLTLSNLSSPIGPGFDNKTDLYDGEETCDPLWEVDPLITSESEEMVPETL